MISECDRVVTSRKKELLSLEPRPSATSIFSLLFSPLLSTTTDYPDYYSSTHLASAMSWQGYVDTNLVGTGKVSKAAIIGLKGGVWATSQGFTVSPQEQTALVNGFSSPDGLQASGIHVDGKKYFTLQANERSIYGKQGADGLVIVKTNQAVLVCQYSSPIVPGEATKVVESLADYLIGTGY